ncbi:hypothetical protein GCM10011613_14090 [Cellvibrio zantedeschiae]|uniref:PilZ domain-containing protein n=1 Tax=Cellvibrio zantedeschiae TaxID=1237077 RepID=A0ABQ3B1H0_9GAMM|nr:hypothetical protein [Cellvibrio zantedeschiae]GGY70770.1 hypothetical protein GCM10011613_14090 [Cellvibrio zantedeschiae]
MEHRCTERISSELKILIYKHNHPIAIGRVKNGSRTGVFVETDFVDIDCEHQLKLEVLLNKNNATKLQRIEMKAIVIHKTSKGFGAEVDFQNTAQADVFVEMLRGTQVGLAEEQTLAMVV